MKPVKDQDILLIHF